MARAVGFVEATGRRHGLEFPIQMTVVTTDGETTWAFRYSSEGRSRSLFHSTDVSTLRHQYPDNPILHELSDDARLVVSEPLGDLRGAWHEVPESTCVTSVAVTRSSGRSRRPFPRSSPETSVAAGDGAAGGDDSGDGVQQLSRRGSSPSLRRTPAR